MPSSPDLTRSRWLPWLFFIACLVAIQQGSSLLDLLGMGESAIPRYWQWTFQSLAWLSGAAIFNQVSQRVIWDGMVSRTLGRPVPAVLKEISALLVYATAIILAFGLVFDRSVTGLLATLGAFGFVVGLALR